MKTKIYTYWVYGLLCSFIALGILSTFLIPPLQAPDESGHWSAALNLTRILDAKPQNEKPCLLSSGFYNYFGTSRISFHYNEKMERGLFANLNLMQPHCVKPFEYPAIIATYPGVLISQAVIPNAESQPEATLVLFYLSRLLGGLVIVVLLFRYLQLGIYSQNKGGLILCAALCHPLFLQQSFTITSDVVVNALALSCITILCRWENLRTIDAILFGFLSIAAAATKPYCVPIAVSFPLVRCLLSTAAPQPTLLRTKSLWLILVVLPIVVAGYSSVRFATWDSHAPGVDIYAQLRYVINSPFITARLFASTIWNSLQPNYFLGTLGWNDTPISSLLTRCYGMLLLTAIIGDGLNGASEPRSKAITNLTGLAKKMLRFGIPLGAIVLTFYLIPLVIYLKWFQVGWTGMHMQTRYLIFPLIALIGLLTYLSNEVRHMVANGNRGAYSSQDRVGFTIAISALLSTCIIGLLLNLGITFLKRYW